MKNLFLALLLIGLPLEAATLPTGTTEQINLAWADPSSSPDPVASYDIYRESGSDGSFDNIGTVPAGTVIYADKTLPSYGASYGYYVTSADAEGNQSPPSDTATAAVPFVPYTPVLGTIKGM